MHTEIRIQEEDFDLSQEYGLLRKQSSCIGAIVCFSGLVREFEKKGDDQPLSSLSLQHYPGMTETLLAEILEEVSQRWSVDAVTVIHRVGKLLPNDQVVFVGVSSAHRLEAFAAAQCIMDYLKTRATIWKSVSDGQESQWVESKQSDLDAAAFWDQHDN